jgi:hypothetical protein
MSKVDTDQGLGPGSEPRRRELIGDPDKKARPVASADAETQPGSGKVERSNDSVDALLEGFGPSRPDLPRILPPAETTPPPEEPVHKELTPTEPGKRQRVRNIAIATVLSFGAITAFGIGVVKLASPSTQAAPSAQPTPTPSATHAATSPTQADTVVPPPTITTMEVESLPSVAKTAPVATAHGTHPPVVTSAATSTAPRPTGSGPPGMSLLPDDPHR